MNSLQSKFLVCCPSYRRPTQVDTLRYFPNISVYIAAGEMAQYRLANRDANLVAMPNKVQGNIARVRNWILDHNKDKIICIVDDDLQYIGYYEKDVEYKIESEDQLMGFLEKYTQVAIDLETPLWGININLDKQCYREYTPFSLTSVVMAPFMVHIHPTCRFDEQLPLKEDYDFCLQTLNRHRKILRVNKYHYLTKQGGSKTGVNQSGGCAVSRSLDKEESQLDLLQKKWGSRIVQRDSLDNSRSHSSKKEKAFDINPVVRVPILGI